MAVLCGAGPVRRRARILRPVLAVAVALSCAARRIAARDCVEFVDLSGGRDCRPQPSADCCMCWDPPRLMPSCALCFLGAGIGVVDIGRPPHRALGAGASVGRRARRRRRAVRAKAARRAGRDVARSVCGVAGRGERTAARFRARHSACRAHRARNPAQRARGRRGRRRDCARPSSDRARHGLEDVSRRGDFRSRPRSCSACRRIFI